MTSIGSSSIDDGSRLGIGLDIGGTSTKAGIVDELGRVVATVTLPSVRGIEGVLETAHRAVVEVAARAGVLVTDVDAIGVGIPGTVDPRRGTVHHAANLGIGAGEAGRGQALRERGGRAHAAASRTCTRGSSAA